MKYIINVLPKYPMPERFGPLNWADWYRQCRKTVELQKDLAACGHAAEILLISDGQFGAWRHETEYYEEVLRELGGERIRIIRDCYETVMQVRKAARIAEEEKKRLIVVATWTHYLRAAWLLIGSGAELQGVFGVPYAQYALADLALTVLYWPIKLFGLEPAYLRYAEKRRKSRILYLS